MKQKHLIPCAHFCASRLLTFRTMAGWLIVVAIVCLCWRKTAAETSVTADPPDGAARRECRLMINWDQINLCGLQLTYAHRTQRPTAESVKAMIEQIVDEHAKARIDRIVHCVFALPRGTVPAGFQSFHRDQIADRLYEDVPSGFDALEAGGYDRIQVTLDRARQQGIEFLGGLRMNDRHRHTSQFHAAHPEWQLTEYAGGMDYKHAGVREAVLNFIDEFLARYDVDGLELDWMRWCHVFRPQEAEQHAGLLTEFLSEVRQRLDRAGQARGRPRLLLGVRVPQSLSECRSLGYDVGAWIRSGDLDFVCPSDFFYTDFNQNTEEFVQLTAGTSVRVYPSLHPLISFGNDHQNQTRESYRAAAKNFLSAGAHGLSAYNFQYHWRADKGDEASWPGVLSYLTGVRDLSEIETGNRHYLFHPMWSGHGGGIGPSGWKRDVRIILRRGQPEAQGALDLRLAEQRDHVGNRIRLRFKVTGLSEADKLVVQFNGTNISDRPHERHTDADGQSAREGRILPAYTAFEFPLMAADIRDGASQLAVSLRSAAAGEDVIVQEIEVLVTVPPFASN